MAKALTKAELIAKINELEAQVLEQQREIDALHVQQRPSRNVAAPAAAPVPATTLTFKQRCAAARELAMRTGRVVRFMP